MAWKTGKTVAMTDMPQMVALYNGMGGGSAAAIGFVELMKFAGGKGETPSQTTLVLAVVGGLIGSISLTGSKIAGPNWVAEWISDLLFQPNNGSTGPVSGCGMNGICVASPWNSR